MSEGTCIKKLREDVEGVKNRLREEVSSLHNTLFQEIEKLANTLRKEINPSPIQQRVVKYKGPKYTPNIQGLTSYNLPM